MKKAEILSPAGSLRGLRAAIAAGCDAAYVGGSRFGARAYADNLGERELLDAIDYCHLHGKRLYLTVNTLLKEEELFDDLIPFLRPFYEQGLDAVIVQDLGAVQLIHEEFPDLPIHASTQMTVTGLEGALLLRDKGVRRIVPARELSLRELKDLKEGAARAGFAVEIEAFAHGALCYAYSGQCLLSSMAGQRSGNRGRCAQPCRLSYRLPCAGEEGHFLSPRDLCALPLLPKLLEAGVDSLKIEGRMKSAEYAAITAHVYRKYADLALELGTEGYADYLRSHAKEYARDLRSLMEAYNRGGFTDGYFERGHGPEMMSMGRPGHNGVPVGTVREVRDGRARVLLSEDVFPQDLLEFRGKDGKALYSYTVGEGARAGEEVWARFRRGSGIARGDGVFRMRCQRLLSAISDRWVERERKVPARGAIEAKVGEPLALTLTEPRGGVSVTALGAIVERARSRPMGEEDFLRAIGQAGDTPFFLEDLAVTVGEGAFVPVGKVKELRREAFSLLARKMTEGYRRGFGGSGGFGIDSGDGVEGGEGVEGGSGGFSGDGGDGRARAASGSPQGNPGAPAAGAAGKRAEVFGRLGAPAPALFVTAWDFGQARAACAADEVRRVALCVEAAWGSPQAADLGEAREGTRGAGLVRRGGQGGQALCGEGRVSPKEERRLLAELARTADLAAASGKEFYVALPYMERHFRYDELLLEFEARRDNPSRRDAGGRADAEAGKPSGRRPGAAGVAGAIRGFLLRNANQIRYGTMFPGANLTLDHNLYAMNGKAKELWREKGVGEFTSSVELSAGELSRMDNRDSSLIVYGRLPLMISAQCVWGNVGRCGKLASASGTPQGCPPCEAGPSAPAVPSASAGSSAFAGSCASAWPLTSADSSAPAVPSASVVRSSAPARPAPYPVLRDAKGRSYFLASRCPEGCGILYDGQAISLGGQWERVRPLGQKFLRLDFTTETEEEARAVLAHFRERFWEGKKAGELPGTRVGHFLRGVE